MVDIVKIETKRTLRSNSAQDSQQKNDRCPLCKGTRAIAVLKKNGYTIVRCQQCELLYVSPTPSDEELAAHYQQASYFEGDADQGYHNYAEMEKALLPHFQRRLHSLEAQLGGPGSLLDFGCASGYFLELAQHAGWQVTGVELSSQMAQVAAERVAQGGGRVFTSLEALDKTEFDAITLWEVIEHLPHPLETLADLTTRLRRRGVLMLSTPNTANWQAQHKPDAWVGYRPPSHLLFFAPQTLTRILETVPLTQVTIIPVSPRPPLPNWLERTTTPMQTQLADGSARPWRFWLYLWRAIRLAGIGWQRLAYPDEDIYTTLEAIAVKPT